MKIKKIEPFIIHVPLPGGGIADSTNSIDHWGYAGVILHTDNGLKGYGFTGTHAFLKGDQFIANFIGEIYGPLLLDFDIEDRSSISKVWKKMHSTPPLQWIGRAGLSHMALAAVDVALWDLYAKAQKLPLWRVLNKNTDPPPLEAYNTNSGWLNIPISELVGGCLQSMDEGFTGVKIKVGSKDPYDDIIRIEAIRKALGWKYKLMIDANGKWSLDTALAYANLLDEFDLFWFEEPLYFDDLVGHIRLAESMKTPVALGEQLYSKFHFDSFMKMGAVHFVQVDALRVGGITEWLEIADCAHNLELPVVPHIGDMMQVHQHLSLAHPASSLLEYIPWTRVCFEEPATVFEGRFVVPQAPGAGTTLTERALNDYRKPLR
jgi:L-alanine-DL-glutamate epimerase-like enolase superfamily enzyme